MEENSEHSEHWGRDFISDFNNAFSVQCELKSNIQNNIEKLVFLVTIINIFPLK